MSLIIIAITAALIYMGHGLNSGPEIEPRNINARSK
jgi:hypothetical protein